MEIRPRVIFGIWFITALPILLLINYNFYSNGLDMNAIRALGGLFILTFLSYSVYQDRTCNFSLSVTLQLGYPFLFTLILNMLVPIELLWINVIFNLFVFSLVALLIYHCRE